MFRLEDTEIAKAVDRCKEVKPTVRVVSFGEYTVTSSKNDGTTYTVKCYRDQQGFKTIDCNCKAGERDNVCFHAMAAVALQSVHGGGADGDSTPRREARSHS
jgi:hypothetical protein